MSRKTDYIMKTLIVISWILFVGLCVQACGFISNAFFTLSLEPAAASKYWLEVDLSAVYNYNQTYFVILISLMIISTVMKALLFYLILRIFNDKSFTLSQPFNEKVKQFILNIAYLALGIGLFSYWGTKFTAQLVTQGLQMPDVAHLSLSGADVWLFMCVILFVIAQIFKRGIEIQNENELTV